MMFWLVLKLGMSYRVIESFWFLLEDFLKIIFLDREEVFEFP
jgi:hypothetical protein